MRGFVFVLSLSVVGCLDGADSNEVASCADVTFDNKSDGPVEESATETYNADHLLLGVENDVGDDGTVDSANDLSYTEDEVTNDFRSQPDGNGGFSFLSTTVTRRANDVLAIFTVDSDADGVLETEMRPVAFRARTRRWSSTTPTPTASSFDSSTS